MSCPSSSAAEAAPTYEINAIVVNGETIAESEIAQEVQHHPSDSVEQAICYASNALIIQRLLKQRARQQGLLQDGAETSEEENAISQLLEQKAYAPAATDEECQRYFAANRSHFCSSPLVEASHILLPAAPDDVKARIELKQQAEALALQLCANPALFAEYAARHSACPSKEMGGSLGQLSKGQTVAEFERVLFNLPGGVAEHPVETRYGYHIVQVHRKVEGQPLEYDMVSDQVRQYLNERAQRKAIGQYLQVLLSDAEIDGFTPQVPGSPLLQ